MGRHARGESLVYKILMVMGYSEGVLFSFKF